jgi:hypothetical protein
MHRGYEDFFISQGLVQNLVDYRYYNIARGGGRLGAGNSGHLAWSGAGRSRHLGAGNGLACEGDGCSRLGAGNCGGLACGGDGIEVPNKGCFFTEQLVNEVFVFEYDAELEAVKVANLTDVSQSKAQSILRL